MEYHSTDQPPLTGLELTKPDHAACAASDTLFPPTKVIFANWVLASCDAVISIRYS